MANYFYRVGDKANPIRRYDTFCCALCQLSLNNGHSLEEIRKVVDSIKEETNQIWNPNNRAGGERSIFVIVTMPYEQNLADKLKQLGFEFRYEFNRRNGYPEGMNQFWSLNW